MDSADALINLRCVFLLLDGLLLTISLTVSE
jgi:hypothetical protein